VFFTIALTAALIYSRDNWVAYVVLGAAGGVYLFGRGFRMLQRKRLIMNTPSSKIRSACMGLVEINGLAVGPATVMAPLTGVPCFFHHSLAWEWRRQGRNNTWVKVAEETVHVPFFLDDNTGRILVDPQGAEMSIHRDFSDEFSQSLFSSSLEIPSNVASFLYRHGVSGDHKFKVEEYCIKPKNALFVLGTLAENHSNYATVPVLTSSNESVGIPARIGGFGWNLPHSSTFTVGKNPATIATSLEVKSPLDAAAQEKVTAALMKAGITNPAAWAAAGVRGAAVVRVGGTTGAATGVAIALEQPPVEQFDLHPPAVLKQGTHEPAFFISWQSQRDVVQALAWKSAAMIWGGPALTLFCVWLLAARFGWL
jgi:E3 Ubiquitin ligase